MIVEHTSEAVNTTTLELKSFTTLDSPMLYKLMYTSLYEDKEKIVLQELSANALDAHIAAGNTDTPIEIILPSELSPELVVKDYGIGMSFDTLTNTYPVYGASTKRSDNNAIGGFGLGSKSPFALSDSFLVESTHKGITTTVSCFLDEGMPKFSIFTSEAAGKHDGTEVRVPVSSRAAQDQLTYKATSLYSLWAVKPKVSKDGGLLKPSDTSGPSCAEEVIDAEDVFLLNTSTMSYSDRNKSLVAVGPFTYALPTGIADRIRNDSKLNDKYKKLSRVIVARYNTTYSTIPKFDIGVLELSPSRETIEGTDANFKVVEETINKISDRVFKGAKSKFDLDWYTRAIDLIKEKGIFVQSPSAKKATLVGIDPTVGTKMLGELLRENPTDFDIAMATDAMKDFEVITEELLKCKPSRTTELTELADSWGCRRLRVRDTALAKHASLGSSYFCMLDIYEVFSQGLSSLAKNYYEARPNTAYTVQMVGSRPAIHERYRHRAEDPRRIPVFIGHEGNRQKFYHWWRGIKDTLLQDLTIFTDPEQYAEDVKWLNEHLPLEEGEISTQVFTIADVDVAWKNRPKAATRRYNSKGSSTAKARAMVTDATRIGEYQCLNSAQEWLTVGKLRDILANDDVKTLYVASNNKYSMRVHALETVPEKYLRQFPSVVIKAKDRNKKAVKEILLEAETRGIEVILSSEISPSTIRKAVESLPKVEDLLSTGSENSQVLYTITGRNKLCDKVTKVLEPLLKKTEDGYVVNPREYLQRLSYRDFYEELPRKLLGKVLLLRYLSDEGKSAEGVLNKADITALRKALKEFNARDDS